jgi:hypothetical protein
MRGFSVWRGRFSGGEGGFRVCVDDFRGRWGGFSGMKDDFSEQGESARWARRGGNAGRAGGGEGVARLVCGEG